MRYLAFNWNREKDISLAETYKSKVVFVDLIKQILFQFFLCTRRFQKLIWRIIDVLLEEKDPLPRKQSSNNTSADCNAKWEWPKKLFFSIDLHTIERQLRNLHNLLTFMKYLTFENRYRQYLKPALGIQVLALPKSGFTSRPTKMMVMMTLMMLLLPNIKKCTSSSFEIQPSWLVPCTIYVEDETRDGRPSNGLICLKRPL